MQGSKEIALKVRIITTATFPDGLASTSRLRCYAKALREEGIEPILVAPRNRRLLNGKKWFYKGTADGISFELMANRMPSRSRLLNYVLHLFSIYWLVGSTLFRIRSFDVCFLYFSQAWPKVILLPILKIARKRIILELNEYPYSGEGNKITKYRIAKKFLQGVTTRLVIPQVDGVLVISERLEQVARKCAPKATILRLPILCDKLPDNPGRRNSLIEPYLFHAGTMSEKKDGITNVIRAFVLVHQKLRASNGANLKFVITNNHTALSTWCAIQDILAKHNLADNLIVTGYLDDDEMARMYANALALIINKPPNEQNIYNFPTKLAAHFSSGAPVVVAARGLEINKYLDNGRNAIVVEPDDCKAIADAIIRCHYNPELVSTLTENARATVRNHFYYDIHRSAIAKVFHSV